MRQFIDAYSIANTVKMNRSRHSGAIVIVEGSSDVRVYRRFFDEKTCLVIPALGKANATGALKMLESEQHRGILVIIDSDFWQLDNIVPDSPNLFTTDTHDLETMIIASPAFEKVLDEFCSEKKRRSSGETIRMILLEIGKPLGLFRWISSSHQENMSLRFKNIDFRKFIRIEGERVSVNIQRLVREVRTNTTNFMYNEREIVEKLRELLRADRHDPWHVCRGHDLVNILAFLLREVFGNRRAKNLTQDTISALLRLSYEYRFFRETKLYRSIREWEGANEGDTVLILA